MGFDFDFTVSFNDYPVDFSCYTADFFDFISYRSHLHGAVVFCKQQALIAFITTAMNAVSVCSTTAQPGTRLD